MFSAEVKGFVAANLKYNSIDETIKVAKDPASENFI